LYAASLLLPQTASGNAWGAAVGSHQYAIELTVASVSASILAIVWASGAGRAWLSAAAVIALLFLGATASQFSYSGLRFGYWVGLVCVLVLSGVLAAAVRNVGWGPPGRAARRSSSGTASLASVLAVVGPGVVIASLFLPVYSTGSSYWTLFDRWSVEVVVLAVAAGVLTFATAWSKRPQLFGVAAPVGFILIGIALPWGDSSGFGSGVWVQALGAVLLAIALVWLAWTVPADGASRGPARGELAFQGGGVGRERGFAVGLMLSVISLGLYFYFWWYLINDELKHVGSAKGDANLSQSNPGNSVIAVLLGGLLVVPPLISVYNTAMRIRRAQRLCGIELERTIEPTLALLLLFPGGVLIIPAFMHYWYMTKHQNSVVRAAAGRSPWR
jgi:hypothetical protein